MKKILEILDFEDKKTQAGKSYVRFKTSEGWMSCFDGKSSEEIKKFKGANVNVEVIESGEFKNIKKFLGKASESPEVSVEKPGKIVENVSNNKFPTSMKVSYAKDCFCALVTRISQAKFDNFSDEEIEHLMEIAINCVNKASTCFK